MKFVIIRLGKETYKEHRDVCVARAVELANQGGHSLLFITDENKFDYMSQEDLRTNLCDAREWSDIIRFKMACVIPDAFYLDTDLYLKSIPVFDQEGKPYFCSGDVFLFYVNNCCGVFQEWWKGRNKHIAEKFWYLFTIRHSEECFKIPESCYAHGYFTALGLPQGLDRLKGIYN